jgi:hypothetical protein
VRQAGLGLGAAVAEDPPGVELQVGDLGCRFAAGPAATLAVGRLEATLAGATELVAAGATELTIPLVALPGAHTGDPEAQSHALADLAARWRAEAPAPA